MDSNYPASPINAPASITKPSKRYLAQAWLAMLGLAGFIGGYLTLAAWLAWTSYRLFVAANEGGEVANFFVGLGSLFLSLFLLKAIFFIKRAKSSDNIEITEADQPRLFSFINQLANEIGAPKPHRVYLSATVNACVFYDLSLLNFILPTKKNLEIGLGLVNVLNVGEFKAVLAHEFGHFAQKSMAVGRWVYISQQIAAHIVGKRDKFDRFLDILSGMDIRIAWVGWLFKIIVWAIRSIVEMVFNLVMLAEKALSREMEFHADLVSVSVTGSDALIHALHKLGAADNAWSRAIDFAITENNSDRQLVDVFTVQQHVIARTAELLNDPSYGKSPIVEISRNNSRLFNRSINSPPNMWATHPSNEEREENAKRIYVRAEINPASAWDLFDNLDVLKKLVAKKIISINGEAEEDLELSLKLLDRQFDIFSLQLKFRGAYLRRSTVRNVERLSDLYSECSTDLRSIFSTLYSDDFFSILKEWRTLKSERETISDHLRAKFRVGSIRFRGKEVTRSELLKLRSEISSNFFRIEDQLKKHDQLCRSVHIAAAAKIGNRWPEYLRGLLYVHHYSSHAEALLGSSKQYFNQIVFREISGNASTKPNIKKIVAAGKVLFNVLARIHADAASLHLDESLCEEMGIASWRNHLQELKLSEPTKESIANWIKVYDSWVNSALSNLASLRFNSIEKLLIQENTVEKAYFANEILSAAPLASVVPNNYPTLSLDQEREILLGDTPGIFSNGGLINSTAKIAIAIGIVGFLAWTTALIGHTTITAYNGLATNVHIRINDVTLDVPPFGHGTIDVGDEKSLKIVATSDQGEVIDKFDATPSGISAHQVYNVASAGVFINWTQTYGNAAQVPQKNLGAPHWISLRTDAEFVEPPTTISIKGGGGTRSVLTGFSKQSPDQVLGSIKDKNEIIRIIKLHSKWDSPNSRYYLEWKYLAKLIEH